MLRTEQIWMGRTPEISRLCHLRKNLYNQANYIVKHFNELDLIIINPKTNKPYSRYEMLNVNLVDSENYQMGQSAQQTLKIVDRDWTSFFGSLKEYKNHPDKFKEMPRPPHYKPKNGETVAVFTNQQCKIQDGYLIFPKKLHLSVKTRIKNLNQVRIVPKGTGYVCEIVYEKKLTEKQIINRRWYAKLKKTGITGIDYGSVNIVTIGNNIGSVPIAIKDDGCGIKSINQFYNKKKAWLQSIYDRRGIKHGTAMSRLNEKRNRKIKDGLHKISRFIVDSCVENNIGLISIGHNEGWKQDINLGKKTNQTFVGIPFNTLTEMIQYKAEEEGIIVKVPEEDHTSKCSFLDLEPIEHRDSYLGKRISRGLFRSSNGTIIHADVNAAYNIIRRSDPNAFANGVGGCVLHPLIISFEGN